MMGLGVCNVILCISLVSVLISLGVIEVFVVINDDLNGVDEVFEELMLVLLLVLDMLKGEKR